LLAALLVVGGMLMIAALVLLQRPQWVTMLPEQVFGLADASQPALEAIDWHGLEARAKAQPACQRRRSGQPSGGGDEPWSTRWIVLTTVNLPTPAVAKLAALPGWRTVVVGDRRTPANWSHPGCVFLSVEDQAALSYRILEHLPYYSYARKNVGYLYAIAHGAEVIYETDDDNLLTDDTVTLLAGDPRTVRVDGAPSVAARGVYNVYGHFGQPTVWPRGYPLDAIAVGTRAAADGENTTRLVVDAGRSAVGVEQGLADGDPDVDAIFRLTRKDDGERLEIAFDPHAPPLVLPPFTFCPFNSQNTIFHAPALWGLLIPTTTTFRVCDIWRAYWAQRLMWDAGAHVLFRAPTVLQNRNVHDYHRDFVDEIDLYRDAGRLVRFLTEWRSNADHLFARVDELTQAMERAGFWNAGDVLLVRAWLRDLLDVCYVPPAPRNPEPPVSAAAAAPAAAVARTWGSALPTALLGCGNNCVAQPVLSGTDSAACAGDAAVTGADVPVWLWDDVVMYTISFPGRHAMMRMARHTWGRHVRRLVIYTTGHDDPEVPTVLLPDPHPEWHAFDPRQSVYTSEVVPRLLELQPPAEFFINVDDDTFPLLDRIHRWLEVYKAHHNGTYPYLVWMPLPIEIKSEERADYKEQVDEVERLFGRRPGEPVGPDTLPPCKFPVGHMYGLSRQALEDMLPYYRTCPILRPGDLNVGALLCCAHSKMTEEARQDRERRTVHTGFLRGGALDDLWRPDFAYETMAPLNGSYPTVVPAMATYYHRVRPENATLAAYRLIYRDGLGIPEDEYTKNIVLKPAT